MRRVVASSVEARSLENLEKEMRLMGKRKAVSGEELVTGAEESGMTTAEVRRGLYAGVINPGERRITVPQHLSLPPPSGGYLSVATPGTDRRLTILSPHSPHQPDIVQFSSSITTLKTRRKKAIVLPRLVLPRSESDVFLE
jgi:cAMP-specific phosphodiesterase 4